MEKNMGKEKLIGKIFLIKNKGRITIKVHLGKDITTGQARGIADSLHEVAVGISRRLEELRNNDKT